MSELPMIETAGGFVIVITQLDVGDVIVIRTDTYPHNYGNLNFRSVPEQAQDVYSAVVKFKPTSGWVHNTYQKPQVAVFKAPKEEA